MRESELEVESGCESERECECESGVCECKCECDCEYGEEGGELAPEGCGSGRILVFLVLVTDSTQLPAPAAAMVSAGNRLLMKRGGGFIEDCPIGERVPLGEARGACFQRCPHEPSSDKRDSWKTS